jgi:predicted transcriptional regulator
MKSVNIIILVLILTTLFYTGCSKSDQESQNQPEVESSASSDPYKISSGTEARFEDLRAEYISKVKTRVTDLNDRIEALQQKKQGAPKELHEEIDKALKSAIEKKDTLNKQFKKLESVSEDNFEIEKTIFTKALNDAENALVDLRASF